jgi:SprB repeat
MKKLFLLGALFISLCAQAGPTAVILNYLPFSCNGSTTPLTVTTSGIVGTITYALNGGTPQSSNVFNVPVGSYTVVVSDGTSQFTNSTVVAPNVNNYVVTPTITHPNCNGGNGSASISVSNPTVTINGAINEIAWGSARATNAGGPVSGFGAGHELNALYATSTATDLYLALAGDVQNNNRIVIWIDCKSGGYNNGGYSRTGAPSGVNNFNSATTFDAGFNADYALTIGTNGLHNDFFFDLFPLTSTGGGGTYLGNNTAANLEGAPGASGSQSAGFEMQIPWSQLGGAPSGSFKVFAMYMSDGGFLSNQFLQRAGPSDGNYGSGAVTFSAATPDPITLQPFSITWSTGVSTTSSATSTLPALAAGTYSVTVSNASGCTSTSSITITQPTVLVANSSNTKILCNGGVTTITVSATGGTPPYTGTATFNVGAGTHNYSVTDSKGCTSTTSITVTQPTLFLANINPGPINCNGGSSAVTVTASGGTMPYTGVGVFSYSVGNYTIIATDSNGCQDASAITITQPTALVASVTATPIYCNGGATNITISATGGTPSYSGVGTSSYNAGTYNFSVTDSKGCVSNTSVTITQPTFLYITTAQISNAPCANGTADILVTAYDGTPGYIGTGVIQKPAGIHTITVTDSFGCVATDIITVTAPNAIVVSANASPILCNSGSSTVVVNATGGSGTYSSGVGSSAKNAGTYTLTVADNAGCTGTLALSITQPNAIVVSATASAITCNGSSSSVVVSATGGSGTYVSGIGTSSKAAGTYTIIVTDNAGCTGSTIITITQPNPITLVATTTNPSCFGGNGFINYGASGTSTSYSYFVNGGFSLSPHMAFAGAYTVVAKDASNCTVSTIVTITQPSAVTLTSSAANASCNGGNGSLTFSASGGTAAYSYKVNNVTQTSPYTAVAGTYTIIVTDANNCQNQSILSITQPNAIMVSATASAIACNGGSSSVVVSATGGSGTYVSGVGTTSKTAGAYTITVSDNAGCTGSTVITITHPPVLSVSISANANPVNSGNSLQLTASSSTAILYSWNLPTMSTASGSIYTVTAGATTAGTYTVVASNATGCTASSTLSITVNSFVKLAAKAMLSGAFNTSTALMTDSLRNGSLPLTEPYSTATYSGSFMHVNGGGENISPSILSVPGNNAIVDWVFLQLRSASNNQQVVATRSALIQRDGDIVDVDGTSPVEFLGTPAGNYFVAVRHRNHVGIMTANAIALSSTPSSTLDFVSTSGAALYTNATYTNTPARTIGITRTLYGGNCSIAGAEAARVSFGSPSMTDRSKLLAATGSTGVIAGYSIFDCDLNGTARFNGGAPDRLVILANCGGSITAVISQHLP